jgi:hypothetical protein
MKFLLCKPFFISLGIFCFSAQIPSSFAANLTNNSSNSSNSSNINNNNGDGKNIIAARTLQQNSRRQFIKNSSSTILKQLQSDQHLSILNTPIQSLSQANQDHIKILITEQLYIYLEEYKSLGLYNYINDFNFVVNIGEKENYYDDGLNTLYLNIDGESSFNHLQLTKKYSFGFDLIKVLSHELAHVQFTHNQQLVDDLSPNSVNLNQHIKSDLLLSTAGSHNTAFFFVHENFADLYGELAYLKKHNFDKDSIDGLKHDLQLRIDLDTYTTSKLGIHADPHDTIQSLTTLLNLVTNEDLKKQIYSLSGEKYDLFVKAIVLNTYKNYLNNDKVKKDILSNLHNGKVLPMDEKYYNQLKIPEYINLPELISNLQKQN